jgi:pyridoxine 5-phosphate synthase
LFSRKRDLLEGTSKLRLGINVDHVATLRRARGEKYPNPTQAAVLAQLGGASNITCHLREDRRHIRDQDVFDLKNTIEIPLNLEMAATQEMLGIALEVKPHAVTLVPEKREELTTEGGLNTRFQREFLKDCIAQLKNAGVLVSLFVEPDTETVRDSAHLGADSVELHTGEFCRRIDCAPRTKAKHSHLLPLIAAASVANEHGMQCHLGHGINYHNASWFTLIPYVEEANVGHAVIARAIFVGLKQATQEMHELLNKSKSYPYASTDADSKII